MTSSSVFLLIFAVAVLSSQATGVATSGVPRQDDVNDTYAENPVSCVHGRTQEFFRGDFFVTPKAQTILLQVFRLFGFSL